MKSLPSLMLLLALLPCSAASITWTAGPTSVVDENDIDLTGTLVHAVNYGSGAQSVTVGAETINFVAGNHLNNANPPLTGDSIVSASGQTVSPDAYVPPGAITNDFHSVMDGFAYDGPNPKVLKLGNLTPGKAYQVQLFVSDDRNCCNGRTQKWSDNATSGSGSETAVFTHGSSTSVIGEFTADGTEQVIYGHGVSQSQNVLNAYVLRETTPLPPTAPTDLSLSNTSLVPALPIGSTVGTLTTMDPNPGDTHTYALVDTGSFPDNSLFVIADGDELQTAEPLGAVGTTYQVKLRTTDNTALSFDKVVSLSVDPVPPVINSLTALPDTIAPGASSTISWNVTNATSLTLNGAPVTGTSTVVSPFSTTTYSLEAINADGTDSADVTVTVANVPDLLPVEVRFVEVVKLNAADTRLHISEIEVFPFGAAPDEADADGTSRNDLVQAVFPSTVTPPTTTDLEHGDPDSVFDGDIESGAAVWTTSDSLGFEPRYMLDLGATFAIDQIRIWGRGDDCCPDRLQNFQVNVYADDGAGNPGTLVNSLLFPSAAPAGTIGPASFSMALPDPGIRSFTVDKPFIPQDEPITLSWEVHPDATSVVIDNGVGDVTGLTDNMGFGSFVVNPGPNVNTTYGLLVTKPSGNSSASVSVEVTDQPLIYSFAADQTIVAPSTPVLLSWAAGNHTTLELNGADVFGTTGTTVSPAVTTTYVLTATNANGTTSEEVRIRAVVPGEPVISEFMADNRGDVTLDEDGDSSDWIEICNPTASDAFLDGYFLTDDPDNLSKWRIPNVVIPPGGYLLVFASGKDRSDPLSELHANFLLQDAGEYLALVKPDGSTMVVEFWPAFPPQKPEVSYGFDDQGLQEGFFLTPTPGAENGATFDGFVGDTTFSLDRGFYDAPISVEITTTEPGAEIRYTLDGTKPTEASGLVYNGPISIASTTVLRAAGFKPGFVPTNVDTQTYIFTADVITQPDMLTSITQDPVYGPQMDASLKAVPTISLVFQGDIERTEKESSVEFINFEAGSTQFDVGMSRFGNYVTNFPKRSMRLFFRSQYGPSKLRFPVFDGFDYDIPVAGEIEALDLRSGNHDMAARGAYLSGRFLDDTAIEMGNLAPHGRFVHVYVNGLYWGQYHLRERWDADMMAEYFPGKEEDYEAINANNTGGNFLEGNVYDGTGQYWNETKNLLNSPTPFTSAATHIDFANIFDFMLLWVSGNSESEFRAAGSVPQGVPFKFWIKDPDGFLRPPGHAADHQGPLSVMAKLDAEGDPDYRILLADRIHKHFFNDGAMTPAKTVARLQRRVDETTLSFISEAARWNYRTPGSWQSYQDNLLNSHLPGLTQTMITRFRNAGMYPNADAPSFNQHGGTVPAGFELAMSAPEGTIYYTTDGSDPRVSEAIGGGDPPTMFVAETAAKTVHVPQDATDGFTDGGGNSWNEVGFDDTGWTAGSGGVGYENNSGYQSYFSINVGPQMSGLRTSCLIRVPFTVAPGGLANLDFLDLKIRYDDAFVAYLNGMEVDRRQFTGTPDGDSGADGSHSDGQAVVFENLDISAHLGKLQEGNNVLAIHGLNSGTNSSDFLISMELVGGDLPEVTVELSPTAVEYTGPVTIDAATPVKSRVLSGGSTWSALNEATFVIDSTGLIVSEFMYDPTPATEAEIAAGFNNSEDFEYLELCNAGSGVIDLSSILLDNGITFDFSTGAITSLAPGERALVVENTAAFEFRYGTGHPVTGQYGGKLNNGGELIRIVNALNVPLIEFTYDNMPPWPVEAAGGGASLVLIDGGPNPDHDSASSWRASTILGGTPGRDNVSAFTFADWATGNGVLNPEDDDDHDGLTNFEEFLKGSSPLAPTPPWSPRFQIELLDVGGVIDAYVTLSITYSLAAANVTTTAEISNDLLSWDGGPGFTKHVHTVYHGNGTATTTWRSATPATSSDKQFLRMHFASP